MPATTSNLVIEQGTTWNKAWQVTVHGNPIDASWVARSQVRRDVKSPEILHTFDCDVSAEGVVSLSVDPTTSTAWDWPNPSGVYDVEIEKAGVVLRVAQGTVTISREVTR